MASSHGIFISERNWCIPVLRVVFTCLLRRLSGLAFRDTGAYRALITQVGPTRRTDWVDLTDWPKQWS